jgi:hypothetical protein
MREWRGIGFFYESGVIAGEAAASWHLQSGA